MQIITLLFILCRGEALLKSFVMKIDLFLPAWLRASFYSAVFGLLSSFYSPVFAQILAPTELSVVGGLSHRLTYSDIEQPFWTQTLSQRSDGAVKAKIKGFDEMGIKGQELLRLMREGIIEFGVVPLSYYAPETPLFEAIDIAGLATDVGAARNSASVFAPVLNHYLESNQKVKLLGAAPYGAQYFYCQADIRSLADLRGLTVRTITRSQAELVEALGAKSMIIPFSEVLQALETKTIHCAIGGAYTAYTAKWYSQASHVYALSLGWNQELHAVNQKAWDKLEIPVQEFIETNVEELIQQLWAFSDKLTKRGLDCLTGSKECPAIPRGNMKLVTPSAADLVTVKRIAAQKVLPMWADRCSDTCVSDFNQTIGKSLNITAVKTMVKK